MDFVAGAIGGVCGVAVGYPLDTVKVKIQTEPKYRGIGHCVWDTYRRERLRGFYRGLSLPVCTVSLISSVSFGTYRHCLAHICRFRYGSPDAKPAKTDITLSGFASGVVRVFLTSPTEVAKVRLQTQTQQRRPSASGPSAAPPMCPAPPAGSVPGPKYRGPLHCLATVAREEGLRGLYKGSSALLFRDGHSFATYFLSYTILCEQLTPAGHSQPGGRAGPAALPGPPALRGDQRPRGGAARPLQGADAQLLPRLPRQHGGLRHLRGRAEAHPGPVHVASPTPPAPTRQRLPDVVVLAEAQSVLGSGPH